MSYEIIEIAAEGNCAECGNRPVLENEIDDKKWEYGTCMYCGHTLAVQEKQAPDHGNDNTILGAG